MSEHLPTFLIAGAAKAGSSSLYHYLGLHPEICMSKGKEPGFFTKNWGRDLRFYAQSFEQCAGARAIGEATVEYMVDPEAPSRIAEVLPDARLVFSLRDPVERAVSHYWHRVKGRFERRPIDAVLRGDEDEYAIRYSLYATHLERFLRFFPAERIHIIIFEEMRNSFETTFSGLLGFLDVDQSFTIVDPRARNPAMIQRSFAIEDSLRSLARGTRGYTWIPSGLRRMGGKIAEFTMRANMRRFRAPVLDPGTRERLQRVFEPEVVRLEQLLGREITTWSLDGTGSAAAGTP
jgi:hypothetical protein